MAWYHSQSLVVYGIASATWHFCSQRNLREMHRSPPEALGEVRIRSGLGLGHLAQVLCPVLITY